MSSRSVRALRSEAQRISKGWMTSDPTFQLKIGWASSYDDLLTGVFKDLSAEPAILEHAQQRGRVILSGRAGSGKTWLLRRLYKVAIDRGWLSIYIDLKQWSGKDYEDWWEWTRESLNYGVEYLLRKFGVPLIDAIGLDAIEPDVRKVLFIDGLNEIASRTGADILTVADELAANQMNTSVVVADRLIRRDLPNGARWSIASVLPLSVEEVQKRLGKHSPVKSQDIRRSPFFLNAQIRSGRPETGRATLLENLLLANSGGVAVSHVELDQIAKASFEAYVAFKSRSFETSYFERIVGTELVRRLQAAGVLASAESNSYFVHHILHDYLASRYFSRQDIDQWTPENFRALSFEASSFDALELSFEQLNSQRADVFLRKLYDWNLYAAGYVLAELNDDDVAVAGREMRAVIFAMLGEKQFDSILATKERAADALRVIQITEVIPFRSARSMENLYDAVQSVLSDTAWFNQWKEMFVSPRSKAFNEEMLLLLREEDSIRGWTVSNVIRRYQGLDGDLVVARMMEFLRASPTPTVRWRIAHVLGAIPNEQAKESLLALLDTDEDVDVRYGAIRSLVEIAAAGSSELRVQIGGELDRRSQSIAKDQRIWRELRACLLIDRVKAPTNWIEFVRTCVRSQFEANQSLSDRDMWRGCLNSAEDLYLARGGAT